MNFSRNFYFLKFPRKWFGYRCLFRGTSRKCHACLIHILRTISHPEQRHGGKVCDAGNPLLQCVLLLLLMHNHPSKPRCGTERQVHIGKASLRDMPRRGIPRATVSHISKPRGGGSSKYNAMKRYRRHFWMSTAVNEEDIFSHAAVKLFSTFNTFGSVHSQFSLW